MIFKEYQERNRAGILSGRTWGLQCDNLLTSISTFKKSVVACDWPRGKAPYCS